MKKINYFILIFWIVLFAVSLLLYHQFYVPKDLKSTTKIFYIVERGVDDGKIAKDLKELGIIKNSLFFRLYIIISDNHPKIQAGNYELSSSESIAFIVKKFVLGNTVKHRITVIEGWNTREIAQYLESRKLFSPGDFLGATLEDWSRNFSFLKERPMSAGAGLEGYLFPDTYEIIPDGNPKELIKNILANFGKKLTNDLRNEIASQKKSIFEIITMASILEKEVKSKEDKKMVSGILWKRIQTGVPLQVDATINYITQRNDASVAIKDTKIDSLYNTYKYYGLPKGPISNPGLDSIMAAIYPTESDYWYYLSAKSDGRTIFSKTLEEHNLAVVKHLK